MSGTLSALTAGLTIRILVLKVLYFHISRLPKLAKVFFRHTIAANLHLAAH